MNKKESLFEIFPTLKNKIHALFLLVLGYGSMKIDNDATVFGFLIIVAVSLFFSNENMID